jgi:hypothetical protein
VPESSACIDGFHVSKNSIPANHEDLCKFENKDDTGYTRTAGFLIDLRDEAVKGKREWISVAYFYDISCLQ